MLERTISLLYDNEKLNVYFQQKFKIQSANEQN